MDPAHRSFSYLPEVQVSVLGRAQERETSMKIHSTVADVRATIDRTRNMKRVYAKPADLHEGIDQAWQAAHTPVGLKCPQIESSSKYLCDRPAEYHIDGTIYCHHHARRLMEQARSRHEATTHEIRRNPEG